MRHREKRPSVPAQEFAAACRGRLLGRTDVTVSSADPLCRAGRRSFTWLRQLDDRTLRRARTLAGALIVIPPPTNKDQRAAVKQLASRNGCLIAASPRLTFSRLLGRFFGHLQTAVESGIDHLARIHPSARLRSNVSVSAFCFVGPGAVLGEWTVLHPGAIVHSRTKIGRRCVIGSNTVVGGPGFGFIRIGEGSLVHFPQVGRVIIEDDVSVGSSTTIDRPGLGETRILRGTKIDSQCHIGHNARVGPHAVVAACAEVGAGVVVGRGAWLGPGSSSIEGVRFGRDSLTGLGSAVLRDVAAGAIVAGCPAVPMEVLHRQRQALKRIAAEQ